MQNQSIIQRSGLQAASIVPPAIAAMCSLLIVHVVEAQPRTVRCTECHREQADQFQSSVHRDALRCQDCHGGAISYELDADQWRRFGFGQAGEVHTATRPATFDHGAEYRGKATRAQVPERCGTCHADVERMNPYGLPTDQLSSYWVSGHGKTLKTIGDERVAVCIDCHGVHDILPSDNPNSRTYFRNVADTCGRCHANPALMSAFNLSSNVVDQYRASIHGRNVVERGDSGSPNCATCHGNHAAAPPGYLEVGHVCGQCHKQIEEYFLTSVHGRVPVMARCIGCHAPGGHRANHEIHEASPAIEVVEATYQRIEDELGRDADALPSRFAEDMHAVSGAIQLETVCSNCHGQQRTDPHAAFFAGSDEAAQSTGRELARLLRDVQYAYARAAARVDRLSRGVMLLRDEAMLREDAKTEAMAINAFVHTLDRAEVKKRAEKVLGICNEIHAGLDEKESALGRRSAFLIPAWGFAAIFSFFMYRKYLSLKHAYVVGPDGSAAQPPSSAMATRRRLLDAVLSVMGAVTLIGLMWPAVTYVLPARKQGGGGERVAAGSDGDWEVWTARKVSVRGKPVAVIRTDKGYRAFSAVCTHLGCIVHWDAADRELKCPCHAAAFDAAGQVVSGPPPRGLPEYGVMVAQGQVIVTQPLEG